MMIIKSYCFIHNYGQNFSKTRISLVGAIFTGPFADSAFSVAQLGNKVCSELIVDGLIMNLQDWHHHVRGWSIEALQRLDNERALKRVIKYLNLSRWDAFPKSGDRTISDQVMRQEDPVR